MKFWNEETFLLIYVSKFDKIKGKKIRTIFYISLNSKNKYSRYSSCEFVFRVC